MAEEGVRDFQTAKRKAAERVGSSDQRHLPTNEEIHAALEQHLHLFHRDRLAQYLRRLRAIAVEAMHFLEVFDPRLVGPVLLGTVTPDSVIQIHISADVIEEIGLLLQEHQIPFTQSERRLRFGGDRHQMLSTYMFSADGAPIELYVFSPRTAREPPLSPIDGRPMRRASIKEVETLLQTSIAP